MRALIGARRAAAGLTLLLLVGGAARAQVVDDPEDQAAEPESKPRTPQAAAAAAAAAGSGKLDKGANKTKVDKSETRQLTGMRGSFTGAYSTELAIDTQLDGGGEHAAQWLSSLLLKAALEPNERLRVVVSGRFRHFTAVERNDGSGPFLLFNGERPRHFFEAELWEAHVDFYLPGRVDLRIGNQLFHWGAADFGSPTDVLNPPDLRFGASGDADELKLPVFAVSATWRGPAFNVSGAWLPFVVPMRAFLVGHDFGLLQPRAYFGVPDLRPLLGDPLSDALQRTAFDGAVPSRSPAHSQGGVRLWGQVRGVDWGLTYWNGYEPFPTVTLAPTLARALALGAGPTPDLARAAPLTATLGPRLQAGEPLFAAEYQRRQVVGFDVTLPAGPLLLRVDAAYSPLQTTFAVRAGEGGEPQVEAVRRPAVTYTASVEYRRDDDLFLVAQWLHLITVTRADDVLFVAKPNVQALLLLARWALLDGDLELAASAMLGVSQGDVVVGGRISYRLHKHLRLSLGCAFFQGSKDGPGGYFDSNDFLFLRVSGTF